MRHDVYKKSATVAAALVVAIMASGRVIAQQAAPQIPAADGQFYACVRIDRDGDEGRLARLVAVNEPCRRNETRVHWGASGPQGLPGTNGTNGTPGAKGANGTNGTNGTNGAPGANGANGTNGTSVTMTGVILKGDARCLNGGVILADAFGTSYLCNGVDASTPRRADGPCFDGTNRYVDCGNGTVTDTVTGLIWLKDVECLRPANWAAANQAAASLASGQCFVLADGSSAGDWRLPTKDEWTATVARATALGCTNFGPQVFPSLTNTPGTACLSAGPSPFIGLPKHEYWSSNSLETAPVNGWAVDLGGLIFTIVKSFEFDVWPVRSGRR